MADPRAVDVLMAVMAERERQDAKWGEQNHPDGTGGWCVLDGGALLRAPLTGGDRRYEAEEAQADCDLAAREGRLTWRHILLEEVYEALAEDDPARLRAELVQVAAVASAWVEAIDRRQAGGSEES